ncbi:MAG: metallophosphoesterase family protein [Anaerotardibacter sp.]
MIIGVISDIHGKLSPSAYEALTGVDHIICAGDIENPQILFELETIAPTTCVMGNCDRFRDTSIPFSADPLLDGVCFRVVHRPEDIGLLDKETAVVIHGHTHVPRNEVIEGIHFINPGSTSYPRGGSSKSIAKITLENKTVQSVEFVSLD